MKKTYRCDQCEAVMINGDYPQLGTSPSVRHHSSGQAGVLFLALICAVLLWKIGDVLKLVEHKCPATRDERQGSAILNKHGIQTKSVMAIMMKSVAIGYRTDNYNTLFAGENLCGVGFGPTLPTNDFSSCEIFGVDFSAQRWCDFHYQSRVTFMMLKRARRFSVRAVKDDVAIYGWQKAVVGEGYNQASSARIEVKTLSSHVSAPRHFQSAIHNAPLSRREYRIGDTDYDERSRKPIAWLKPVAGGGLMIIALCCSAHSIYFFRTGLLLVGLILLLTTTCLTYFALHLLVCV